MISVNTLLLLTLLPQLLWHDVSASVLPVTAEWTNRVALADIDGDGRVDLLFANGGNYSEPGAPELNRVFLNRTENGVLRFEERTEEVFGSTGDIARVIQVRDVDGDGNVDIFVGTTFQSQSRLYQGRGGGRFDEATKTHLPQMPLSVGDLEIGDVDSDDDLDVVLADWGPGDNMTNAGGRTRLWLNDGSGRFEDQTAERMPEALIRFSWDLNLVDVDNDADLDVVVSCKRCGGGTLFRNDGGGRFQEDYRAIPQYTNNYAFEPMDVNGDGFLDLVTVNDGAIVDGESVSRREHLFVNDGKGSFRDRTPELWPDSENVGEDDNAVAFLDADSDGDAGLSPRFAHGSGPTSRERRKRPFHRRDRCLRRRRDPGDARHRRRRSGWRWTSRRRPGAGRASQGGRRESLPGSRASAGHDAACDRDRLGGRESSRDSGSGPRFQDSQPARGLA